MRKGLVLLAAVVLVACVLSWPAMAADLPTGNGISPVSEDRHMGRLWNYLIAGAMLAGTVGEATMNARRIDLD